MLWDALKLLLITLNKRIFAQQADHKKRTLSIETTILGIGHISSFKVKIVLNYCIAQNAIVNVLISKSIFDRCY